MKFTIGIRLSPEEEIRGLDYIGKNKIPFFSTYVDLLMFIVVAHGEKWDISGGKTQQLATSELNGRTSLPPPYVAATRSELNRTKTRSRSRINRQRQVRLRPERDPIRPAYTRSASQQDYPV